MLQAVVAQSNLERAIEQELKISIYPNPAIDDISIELEHANGEEYRFVIYNVLGSELKSFKIDTRVSTKLDTKVDFLRKGVYLYRLLDQSGKTLTTRRLMVIRP